MNRIVFCCFSNILPIFYIPVYCMCPNLVRSDLALMADPFLLLRLCHLWLESVEVRHSLAAYQAAEPPG